MNDNLFETEKNQNRNWNLFLFNLSFSLLDKNQIILINYSEKNYGSWIIEHTFKRILYDGRDDIFLTQIKNKDEWVNTYAFFKKELTYTLLELSIK
ncbi:hypothetical protein [Flavobacterium beibuense]|uniref:hypothetical protein n=1 Tax=Flavobacterium beibuense TaxID=657326 RepID=UPI003A91C216